jgi:hypothetical protein
MPNTEVNRAEINRANAQHSTGPKTEEGKLRSSLNALRHGLTGQVVVMRDEDMQAYQRHVLSFNDEYNPQGATEAHLVQALADAAWRQNRAAALETNLISGLAGYQGPRTELDDAICNSKSLEMRIKQLSILSVHSQRLSRQFERTEKHLRELQQLRKEQEKKEMEKLLDIMETYESKGERYDPSTDGFVFSPTKIESAKRLRTRERQAQKRPA